MRIGIGIDPTIQRREKMSKIWKDTMNLNPFKVSESEPKLDIYWTTPPFLYLFHLNSFHLIV